MEVVEAVEVIEAAEVLKSRKSLLRTPESARFLNSALIWCFENHFFWYDHEITCFNFCTFFVGGCRSQPRLHFWKLVPINTISTSQNFKTTFKHNVTCIFLSIRAKKKPVCPRTPCKYKDSFLFQLWFSWNHWRPWRQSNLWPSNQTTLFGD